MPTRRFLMYAFAYFCAVIMYYFFIGWFAGFLLVVMAIVPLVSILGSLPGMLSCRVGLSADEYGRVGGNLVFKVSARTRHGLLFGKSVVWYNVENFFTEEEYLRRRVKLFGADADETVTIAGLDSCGCVSITVKKVKVYDFMGLISLKKALPDSAVTAVLPEYPVGEPESAELFSGEGRLVPKRGGGFAEEYELREYQPGDMVTSIHWKLTSKLGKPIIREPMVPEKREITVTINPEKEPDKCIARLYRLCGELTERGLEYTLRWGAYDGEESREIAGTDDLNRGMKALMSAPAREIRPVCGGQTEGFLVENGEVTAL